MIIIFLLLTLSFAQEKTVTCNTGITCKLNETSSTLTVSGKGPWTTIEGIDYNWMVDILIIGKEVTSIEHSFFSHSFSLKSIICEEGCTLKTIGQKAFEGVSLLQTFPSKTIEHIGNEAFKETKFPAFDFSSIKTIGDRAFQNSKIKAPTFPATLESFGEDVFGGCSVKDYVVLEGNPIYSVDKIGALYENKNNVKTLVAYPPLNEATTYKIADGTTVVKSYAFNDANILTLVDLNNVVTVQQYAFNNCKKIKEFKLGEKTTDLKKGSFNGCVAIEIFTVPTTNTFFVSEDGVLLTKNAQNKALIKYPSKKQVPNNGVYTIPENVKVIYDYSFESVTGLKELTIGGEVYSIHSYAFKGCKELSKVTITAKIRSVGSYVFSQLSNLKTVVIGDNVKMIGKGMFAHCPLSTSFTMGKGVMSIESYAFSYVDLTSITIPDECVFIMSRAFYTSNKLTKVKIGAKVKEISEYAFSNCATLKEIDLSSATGLQRIDENAFSTSRSLKTIVIPSNIRIIADYAFAYSSIETITFKGTTKPNYCSSVAFKETKATKVIVPKDYEHQRFCGLEIEKSG